MLEKAVVGLSKQNKKKTFQQQRQAIKHF